MFNISQFFSRINNHRLKELVVRQDISRIIKEIVGIDIDIKDINIKSTNIILNNISQIIKNELYIKKEKILVRINQGRKTKYTNIR